MKEYLENLANAEFKNDAALMDHVLRAYFNHTRYLKSSNIIRNGDPTEGGKLTAFCYFAIDESCYIKDTGHFNSVEFNICYNQMMYYAIAKAVKHRLMNAFCNWSLDDFFRKQLPDILITKFQSSFKRPLNPRSFSGEINFTETRLRERKIKSSLLYLKTGCFFSDEAGGYCEGGVDLAILNPI